MEQKRRITVKIITLCAVFLLLLQLLLPTSYAAYFSDVSYYSLDTETYEAIMYVSDNGIMNGVSSGVFSPNTQFTRAQVAQMLYNMAGSPAGTYSTPFTDVPWNAWYATAVGWAYQNGITNGIDSTTFAPNLPVTRQQIVTFLYRYATTIVGLSYNTSAFVPLSSFSDGSAVYPTHVVPMRWAATYCILQPDASNMLHPTSIAYRKEVALYISRYEKNAVGFFDGNKKYNGQNLVDSNALTYNMQQRLFDIADNIFSASEAGEIKNSILAEENKSGAKCTGICFANYLDVTGRHDFNRAIGMQGYAMSELGPYANNNRLRSAMNFYQLGNALVYTERTIAMTSSEINQFYNEVVTHGPVIAAFFWHEGNNKFGHSIIVTKVRKLSPTLYELTFCDPNSTSQSVMNLSYSAGSISFCSHILTSFEYYSNTAMQTIKYLDIDGQYNTMVAD